MKVINKYHQSPMPTIKKINICNEAGVTAPIQTLCQKGAWQKCIGEWCQVCRGLARVGSEEFDTWFAPNFPRLRCSGLCNSLERPEQFLFRFVVVHINASQNIKPSPQLMLAGEPRLDGLPPKPQHGIPETNQHQEYIVTSSLRFLI